MKRSTITGVLICCILCGVSLFVFSYRFVNVEITPKWMGLMICVGISGITWSLLNLKISLPAKPILIIIMCSFLLVFVRKWVTLNFDPALLLYLSGLLFLFFIIQQTVTVGHPKYLYGTVIVFALALSVQGIETVI